MYIKEEYDKKHVIMNIGENMNILEIIDKKRKKQKLSKEEIEYMIQGYLDESIKDYQMSALLMAIVLNGMNEDEVVDLTTAMLNSGEVMDLSSISGIKVDKHSTGGVGDKTTLILAPLVASCGVPVAKMSGRGLGHTGGTIDKLESIPGFQVDLSVENFIREVNEIGLSIVSQTGNLVPADKKLYALRDVTGTVESIPLIASSIMSKKLASGADKIVIDVKVGNGALVKTIEEAKKLAQLMVHIGNSHQKETVCVITRMSEPLGCAIGNALEVLEGIEVLKGGGPEDLKELVLTLATIMVSLGLECQMEQASKLVKQNLENGKAYQKFLEFVKAQKGNLDELVVGPKIFSIKAPKSGIVNHIDALKLGELARSIGAGRMTKEDKIDYGVGFVLSKKVGDFVLQDEELMKVYLNEKDVHLDVLLSCFMIEDDYTNTGPLIHEIVK